ncbi:MAG: serine/threonine-protein phosphatase [Lachnospiraceae bacterium]|nr:serine/threonine-protein phosphatase [Lachnospiraceae bacterium]
MKETKKPKRRSIKAGIFRILGLGLVAILLETVLIGFASYLYSDLIAYKNDLRGLARYALDMIGKDYVEEILYETKRLYASVPEEVRKDPFTDEFRAYIMPHLGDRYFRARDILVKCRENTGLSNIFLAFYDETHERLVFALDGNIEDYYYIPGQYVSNENGELESREEIQRILDSDWYMFMEHTSLIGFNVTDYVPVYSRGNEMIGLVGINVYLEDLVDEFLFFLIAFIPLVLIVFSLIAFAISRGVQKMVIRPIDALSETARAYMGRDKVNVSEDTHYFESVAVSYGNELEEFRNTMAEMECDINESIRKIREISAEKERIAAELEIAAGIQREALPSVFPAFPDRDEFDLYASMTPAKEVGGDFYDFFLIDPDHLALVIADVSGKGMPAALFMMKGKGILKNRAMQGGSPSEILGYVNNELCKENASSMFITIWLGILEISTGKVDAASAGHEYPFISDENGTYRMYEDPHGLICGIMSGSAYQDYSFTVPVGGGVFVYTDGVTEAQTAQDEQFGFDRIEESLNRRGASSPEEVISHMKEDIKAFAADAEQFDDITMLCLIRRKKND